MQSFDAAAAFEVVARNYTFTSQITQGGITGEARTVDDHEIIFRAPSDIRAKVMKDFKATVQSSLESNGAQVYGANTSGDIKDFHLKYLAGKNRGGVLAYSATQTNGETRIVILIYEEAQ